MRTRYFTLLRGIIYHYKGNTLGGSTCIVRITDENPRDKMFETFGDMWCFEYNSLDGLLYLDSYTQGIFDLTENRFEPINSNFSLN